MKGSALGVAVAVLTMAVGSVEVWAETLTETLVTTYAHNPILRAKRAEVRSVDENLPQALAGWRPTAGAGS